MGLEVCKCEKPPVPEGEPAFRIFAGGRYCQATQSATANVHPNARYQLVHEIAGGPATLAFLVSDLRDGTEYALRATLRDRAEAFHDRRVDTRGYYNGTDPSTVRHPHLARYVDVFHCGNMLCNVVAYYPGGTMEDLVVEPSSNSMNVATHKFLSRVGKLFAQVTDALRYLHDELNLIHGNIKLENIFLTDASRNSAVLGDLGRLAKVEDAKGQATNRLGAYVGNALYVAPEVIAGGAASFASDVYSLGACVYVASARSPSGAHILALADSIEASIAASPRTPVLTLKDDVSLSGPVLDFMNCTLPMEAGNRRSASTLISHPWFTAHKSAWDDDLATFSGGDDAIPRVFITSDEGSDLDLELSKVAATTLVRRGYFRLIGCCASLAPAATRALIIKGTLTELGHESVPVAVATERASPQGISHELPDYYSAGEGGLYSAGGMELCHEVLTRSPDRTVTFIVQSGASDIVKCVNKYPDLFMRKVARVIIRAELKFKVKGKKLQLTKHGRMIPEAGTASSADQMALCNLFETLQELGVPMTIVTHHVMLAAKLPMDLYKTLSRTQHPVAQRLAHAFRTYLQKLWERCNLPLEDPARGDLPLGCSPMWFSRVFLAGRGLERGQNDKIWDMCSTLGTNSCVQMLAAVPGLKAKLFKVTEVSVASHARKDVVHEILGFSEEDHGVANVGETVNYLCEALLTGFTGTDMVQQPLLILSDDGKDLDDELTKVLLNSLVARGLARCHGFVACLHPVEQRARLSKGTLNRLGLDCPVGCGAAMKEVNYHDYEFEVDYLADPSEVQPDGVNLFTSILENTENCMFNLVILSGMRDAWELLRRNGELFRQKIGRVVIMGGVQVEGGRPIMSEEGFLQPDTAANNAFDMEAAEAFYHELQRQSIPMTIVSRWAAYAVKLPLSLYDRMATTCHPVAQRLQKVQQRSLQSLWERANMAPDNPARGGLPARCDKVWFCNVFLAGEGKERSGSDSIWDLAGTFQAYDPIALLAALPGVRERYLDPTVFPIRGQHGLAVHEVMGLDEEVAGVRHPSALRRWLQEAMLEGVAPRRRNSLTDSESSSLMYVMQSRQSNNPNQARGLAQELAKKAPKMPPSDCLRIKRALQACSQVSSDARQLPVQL